MARAKKTKTAATVEPDSAQPEKSKRPAFRKLRRPQWLRVPARLRRTRRPRSPFNPHRAFRLTPVRRRESAVRSMLAGWRLVVETFRFCKLHIKKLGGLAVLYAVLAYFIAGGLSQVDYITLRESVEDTVGGKATSLGGVVTLFGGSLAAIGRSGGELQRFLAGLVVILFGLAVIWSVRMLMAKKTFVLRDALYTTSGPLIPALLIVVVMTLQMIPAILGIFAYAAAAGGDLLGGGVEGLAFGAAGLLLSTLSLYWVSGSLMALIIVTLPGMYPMRALREARDLVAGRRWRVLLRVLVLALIIGTAWLIVLAPVILLDSWLRVSWLPLVPIVVQVLAGFTLVFSSTYLYRLYRTLI